MAHAGARLLSAVAMLSLAPSWQTASAYEPTGAEDHLSADANQPDAVRPWIPLGNSEDVTVYISPRGVERDGALARAWVRYEYGRSTRWMGYFDAMSVVKHVEVDCGRGLLRDLASTAYSANDLSGESRSWVATKATLWTPVTPGTLGDSIRKATCSKAGGRPPGKLVQ